MLKHETERQIADMQPQHNDILKEVYEKILSYHLNWYWVFLLLCTDSIISMFIVKRVAYTEIDWRAYMEEVEGYLGGERDYIKIEGNTGPLVYPAGFLYIFSLFRAITDDGVNIVKAQWLFVGIYLGNLFTVLWCYLRSGKIPFLWCVLLILSKRVHSIFMLRMFNDCVAILFGYIAIVLFTYKYWKAGSVVYSISVSIKMNMFLFAPGIFFLFLFDIGISGTIQCIGICAAVQLVLGLPFLATHPISYVSKAFEFSRVFMYKWTVNFKFLPENVFLSKKLSVFLLLLTALAYLIFGYNWIYEIDRGVRDGASKKNRSEESVLKRFRHSLLGTGKATPAFICFAILTSNMIGIIFARSLHYQFYSWYFHSLPLLLFQTHLPLLMSGIIILCIEVSFNIYPAQWWSSLLLQICHIAIFASLLTSPVPYLQGKYMVVGKEKIK